MLKEKTGKAGYDNDFTKLYFSQFFFEMGVDKNCEKRIIDEVFVGRKSNRIVAKWKCAIILLIW